MTHPRQKTTTDITIEDLYYPVTAAFNDGMLDVGHGHQLYYHQYGNPKGPAVLIVHGGPGVPTLAGGRAIRSIDPSFFRIVALDQRGCGRSTPHFAQQPAAALHKNDPLSLAQDFEKLRHHLGISKWHVTGISWGSCLGLYYASLYPSSVLSLTLGGIWMHTPQEIDWYINRMGYFLPEAEEKLLNLLPKSTKKYDRLGSLYKAITGKDKKHALAVAQAQGEFETAAVGFHPAAAPSPTTPKIKTTAKARKELVQLLISQGVLEIHFMHRHPLPENWFKSPAVKKAIGSIKDFYIQQGRYDIICPPMTAYDLHNTFAHSQMNMVHYSGHGITREPLPLSQWMQACERLKKEPFYS